MENYICASPVIFIFFNRPESMKKALEQIRKVRPKKLYFVADGPRNEEEKNKTDLCREIAESMVDWDCELAKIYAESNMGCKNRVASGITQVLNIEDRAIILEDDCVPDISFFRFEDEMLEKYKDEEQIFRVSGRNDLGIYECDSDYIFTHRAPIWGWGTWARAWNKYDIEMTNWPEVRRQKNNYIKQVLGWKSYYVMKLNWNAVYQNRIDTWDYQWAFAMWINKGYGIVPVKNLIENIGFDENATHTKKKEERYQIETHTLEFPLKNPQNNTVDLIYDKLYNQRFVEKGFYKFVIKNILKKIFRLLGIKK